MNVATNSNETSKIIRIALELKAFLIDLLKNSQLRSSHDILLHVNAFLSDRGMTLASLPTSQRAYIIKLIEKIKYQVKVFIERREQAKRKSIKPRCVPVGYHGENNAYTHYKPKTKTPEEILELTQKFSLSLQTLNFYLYFLIQLRMMYSDRNLAIKEFYESLSIKQQIEFKPYKDFVFGELVPSRCDLRKLATLVNHAAQKPNFAKVASPLIFSQHRVPAHLPLENKSKQPQGSPRKPYQADPKIFTQLNNQDSNRRRRRHVRTPNPFDLHRV